MKCTCLVLHWSSAELQWRTSVKPLRQHYICSSIHLKHWVIQGHFSDNKITSRNSLTCLDLKHYYYERLAVFFFYMQSDLLAGQHCDLSLSPSPLAILTLDPLVTIVTVQTHRPNFKKNALPLSYLTSKFESFQLASTSFQGSAFLNCVAWHFWRLAIGLYADSWTTYVKESFLWADGEPWKQVKPFAFTLNHTVKQGY